MANTFVPLLVEYFRRALAPKSIAILAVALLFPVGLTAAWVASHGSDVAVTELQWPSEIVEGNETTITAIVRNNGTSQTPKFNSTLAVGTVSGGGIIVSAHVINSSTLQAGESIPMRLSWTPPRAGLYWIVSYADCAACESLPPPSDDVGEKEEFNNDRLSPVVVKHRPLLAADAPTPPQNITGSTNGTAFDLVLSEIRAMSESPKADENATYDVTLTNNGPNRAENITLNLRLGVSLEGRLAPVLTQTEKVVSLDPGNSTNLFLTWRASTGPRWVTASAIVTGNQTDTNATNNHVAKPILIQPDVPSDVTPPKAPEKLTIKVFYYEYMARVHLPLLVPLMALLFAGGFLADERDRKSLSYLLTRPVPKWSIPVAQFIVTIVFVSVALAIGTLVGFAILFGAQTPGADLNFLTMPLVMNLLGLIVYSAVFVLLGVIVARPYLIGLLFVVGWETVVSQLVEWAKWLSIRQYALAILEPWRATSNVLWFIEGPQLKPLLIALGIGAVALVAAAVLMKQREFETS